MEMLSASIFFTSFMVEGSFYFFSYVLVQVSRFYVTNGVNS